MCKFNPASPQPRPTPQSLELMIPKGWYLGDTTLAKRWRLRAPRDQDQDLADGSGVGAERGLTAVTPLLEPHNSEYLKGP